MLVHVFADTVLVTYAQPLPRQEGNGGKENGRLTSTRICEKTPWYPPGSRDTGTQTFPRRSWWPRAPASGSSFRLAWVSRRRLATPPCLRPTRQSSRDRSAGSSVTKGVVGPLYVATEGQVVDDGISQVGEAVDIRGPIMMVIHGRITAIMDEIAQPCTTLAVGGGPSWLR